MRNMFALIGVLVVGVGGAGWYLGWYKVNFTKAPDGNLQIQTEVDTQKLSGDSAAFFQKMGQMASEHAKKSGQNTNAGQPATTPGNTPGPVPPGPATPPGNTPPKDTPIPGNGLAPNNPNDSNPPTNPTQPSSGME